MSLKLTARQAVLGIDRLVAACCDLKRNLALIEVLDHGRRLVVGRLHLELHHLLAQVSEVKLNILDRLR